MKREGRKIAVRNLIDRKIDRLVIIGGDGSLTGAHYLSKEWPELVAEVVRERRQSNPNIGGSIEDDEEFIKV